MPDRPDIARGEHLPKLRPGTQPPDPTWLPRQRRGTTPQMIGRYPDFHALLLETAVRLTGPDASWLPKEAP